ncbi:hypothetical protein [Acidithiobacillus sp.]
MGDPLQVFNTFTERLACDGLEFFQQKGRFAAPDPPTRMSGAGAIYSAAWVSSKVYAVGSKSGVGG